MAKFEDQTGSVKTRMPPLYVSGCVDKDLLCDAMDCMLQAVSANNDMGYRLDVETIIQYVKDGMTLETFNQLALNLNRELSTQFKSVGGTYGFAKSYNQSTIH